MSKENEPCTWAEMEARLFDNGAKLLEVVMQAAQARAVQNDSQVLTDLLHRTDLAPRLVVAVSGAAGDMLTMGVWLHHRDTGAAVARLFEINARAEVPSWIH
jgi:hypothetical protein